MSVADFIVQTEMGPQTYSSSRPFHGQMTLQKADGLRVARVAPPKIQSTSPVGPNTHPSSPKKNTPWKMIPCDPQKPLLARGKSRLSRSQGPALETQDLLGPDVTTKSPRRGRPDSTRPAQPEEPRPARARRRRFAAAGRLDGSTVFSLEAKWLKQKDHKDPKHEMPPHYVIDL